MPPLEIEIACSTVFFADAEPAAAWSAAIDGKWSSAIRWKGGALPSAVPTIFDAVNFVIPLKFSGVTIGA